jgi:hypothetical protein
VQLKIILLLSFIGSVLLSNQGLCQSIEINSEVKDTTVHDTTGVKNTILPFLFFLPETGLAFGVTGITTFRLDGESMASRPSQIIYSAAYTLKNQILLYVPFEIYKDENKIRYKGELGFYKYFYNYYGIGNNSLESDLGNYDVTFPRIDFNYSRSDIDNLFFGAGFKYDNFNITSIDSSDLLITTQPIGVEGGQKLNLLLNAFYDNRDNVLSTSKGLYAELRYEKSIDFLWSDFDYWKYIIDARYFFSIKKDFVIASQFFGSHASDSSPFFDLPYISTPSIARGYSDRRFINYNILNLQTELRFPIKGRFKGATFISSTYVPDNLDNITQYSPKWSYGLGIRYEFDKVEKTRFRLDFAYGETFNIYLTANEAF